MSRVRIMASSATAVPQVVTVIDADATSQQPKTSQHKDMQEAIAEAMMNEIVMAHLTIESLCKLIPEEQRQGNAVVRTLMEHLTLAKGRRQVLVTRYNRGV